VSKFQKVQNPEGKEEKEGGGGEDLGRNIEYTIVLRGIVDV
jgi:hypothetical protein